MKKFVFFTILLVSGGLYSCHKYTSTENGNALPADMVATIGAQPWAAADSAQSAVFSQGFATISGISANGQEISITLNDTVVGMYTLNQTSPSLAIYANLDSTGSYAYSTNQGSDTAQAGGTVNVLSVNEATKTISGIFSFNVYRNQDNSQVDITQGVFYNIPFVEQ